MQMLGWILQPSVFPWVMLATGLCIGSFLNVVIHRLPKMLEREWRADCAELTGQPAPAGEPYNQSLNVAEAPIRTVWLGWTPNEAVMVALGRKSSAWSGSMLKLVLAPPGPVRVMLVLF